MSPDHYRYPVAISRLSSGESSREPQNIRAIKWLLEQPGGPVVVVTPQKNFAGTSIAQLVKHPRVKHLSWRGLSTGSLAGHRVIYAWPDRQHLNDLWGVVAEALVVIEWNESDSAEWISIANPEQLFVDRTVKPVTGADPSGSTERLPNGVEEILRHVANMAAGYTSGLKWNEEDQLKADMMNCPERWEPITVEDVRDKCREFGMRPNDVDTVAGFLQRRKDGRRFNVRGSYRTFTFKRPEEIS